MKKTRVLLALLAFLAAGAAEVSAQQLNRVTVAIAYIPNIQFTPLYVGMRNGYYRDAGIDLKIDYGFDVDIFSLLAAGKIDLGLADGDQLVLSGAKNMGLVSVYQYYQRYPVAIVARKGIVDSPAQFAGKTIGTPALYGSSYIGLQLFLQHYGLSGKVKIENIGYTQIPALMSGKVDGAVVFTTNEVVHLRQLGVAINEWDVRSFSDMVGSSFISSREIATKRADVLRRFFAATSRAIEFIKAHPSAAVKIAMGYMTGSDASQVPFLSASLGATLSLLESPHGFGYIDSKTYSDSIGTLAKLGLIPGVYPTARIIDPLGPAN